MNVTYQGRALQVHLPKMSLRNHKNLMEWAGKIDDQCRETAVDVQLASIRRMIATFPEAADYIDTRGNISAEAVRIRMAHIQAHEEEKKRESEDYELLPTAAIREEATAWVSDKWKKWISENPDAAYILMFQTTDYPTDISALLLGVECMRATCCRVQTDAETLALIDGDLETDFWLDIDALEVADYCTQFRAAYKTR